MHCIIPESIVPYETTLKWNFNKSQFTWNTSVTMAASDIYIYYILGNVFRDGTFFQFHSFRSIRNFANLRVPRITMTTPLVNIQFVALKEKERGKERERDSSNQIHRDSSGHACRSGCTTLYRRLSSPPLDPPPPLYVSTPPHAFLFLALSLSSRCS